MARFVINSTSKVKYFPRELHSRIFLSIVKSETATQFSFVRDQKRLKFCIYELKVSFSIYRRSTSFTKEIVRTRYILSYIATCIHSYKSFHTNQKLRNKKVFSVISSNASTFELKTSSNFASVLLILRLNKILSHKIFGVITFQRIYFPC